MTDTITIPVPADLVFTFRDHAVPIGSVDPKGLVYLLLNGWSQSLTDVSTSARAKVINDAADEWFKANGRAPDAKERAGIVEGLTDAIATAESDAIAKRLTAIMEGAMVAGQRGGGPRKSPLEAYVWMRAEADAKGIVRDKGRKWPKDAAEANAIVEKVLHARRRAYEKDFAKNGKADDLDIDI